MNETYRRRTMEHLTTIRDIKPRDSIERHTIDMFYYRSTTFNTKVLLTKYMSTAASVIRTDATHTTAIDQSRTSDGSCIPISVHPKKVATVASLRTLRSARTCPTTTHHCAIHKRRNFTYANDSSSRASSHAFIDRLRTLPRHIGRNARRTNHTTTKTSINAPCFHTYCMHASPHAPATFFAFFSFLFLSRMELTHDQQGTRKGHQKARNGRVQRYCTCRQYDHMIGQTE